MYMRYGVYFKESALFTDNMIDKRSISYKALDLTHSSGGQMFATLMLNIYIHFDPGPPP